MAITSLRELTAQNTEFMLHESGWELPTIVVTPDGIEHELTGQVIYPCVVEDAQSGVDLVSKKISVVYSLRAADFTLPTDVNYTECIIKIPERPYDTETLVSYAIARVKSGGASFDFVTYYLRKVEQI